MKSRLRSFNIYFTLALACLAGALAGCKLMWDTTGQHKELTSMRFYLEGERPHASNTGTVLVTSNKFPYIIEREPFLDESDLTKASMVKDADGTFYLQLTFNEHGMLLLDMYTASNKGKHIIIFSQFPTPGLHPKKQHKKKTDDDTGDSDDSGDSPPVYPPGTPRQKGWLAAVLIRDRISNGVFRFTPDASPAEGARIVRGLKNVIHQNGVKEKKDE